MQKTLWSPINQKSNSMKAPKLHIIETGKFKLDGGAMFGVVPKKLWSKLNEPDIDNLCTWSMRCLLVEDGERKILIDTGIGNKQDDKFMSHFHPHGDDDLKRSLKDAGFDVEDITDVLLTHFHFDHVGGAVEMDSKGNLVPTFPNATYWTNELHYSAAYEPNQREKASFLKENFLPLKEHGILKYIDINEETLFTDHINLIFSDCHTDKMMVPIINLGNGHNLVYTADLLPSHCHINMPYVMSYDIRPLETLREKAALYERVLDGNHTIFFEHDKDMAMAQLTKNDRGRVILDRAVALIDIL